MIDASELAKFYPGEWAFHLHPLYGPDAQVVAPGKMPKIPNWPSLPAQLRQSGATSEEIYEDVLTEHLKKGDNLGLVVPDSVVVFDCDDASYVDKLLALYPEAPAQLTRRGGCHLFFRLKPNEGFSNTTQLHLHGAKGDIRAKGGQVVVYPSIGVGGGAYTWIRPLPQKFEDLPLRPEELAKVATMVRRGPEVERQDWGRRPDVGPPPRSETAAPLKKWDEETYHKIINGKPLALPGDRDNAMVRAIGAIYAYCNTTNPSIAFAILGASIAADSGQGAPSIDKLWTTACRLADRHSAEIERLRRVREAMEHKRIETATAVSGEMAVSLEELQRRLVLYIQSSYYILNERTRVYEGPVGSNGLIERLERLSPSLVDLRLLRSDKGASRSDKDVLAAYGTPVATLEMRVGEVGARYDPNGNKVVQGLWQVRSDLVPTFDERVDKWLTLLGGTHHEKLKDWLATVTQLKYPSCAIYLRGPKKAGKGMLAQGLARIWGQPYTPYRVATNRFNDALLRCPIVFLDEGLANGQDSTVFREFVSAGEITVEKKYQSPITLVGSPRVLIASNNDDALKIRDEVGAEDLDAITDRIGWVEIDAQCPVYLEAIGGRHTGTNDWVDGDRIAKHVLWLGQNRTVVPGSRFMVEGWDHPKLRRLPSRMRGTGETLSVLAHYLADVTEGRVAQKTHIFVGDGKVLVNTPALIEYWDGAGSRAGVRPSEAAVGRALKVISPVGQQVITMPDGARMRAWSVDVEQVLGIADEVGIGDSAKIRSFVQTGKVGTGRAPKAN